MELSKIGEILSTVTPNVSRYFAFKKTAPYLVWAEDSGTGTLYADNAPLARKAQGTVDYFTKIPDDPNVQRIQQVMALHQIPLTLLSVQYEEDTKYIHHEWRFELWLD